MADVIHFGNWHNRFPGDIVELVQVLVASTKNWSTDTSAFQWQCY